LAQGHPYLGLGAVAVSDDGHRLAYTTDVTGFREYTLYVKDLRTGDLAPDRIEKVVSVAWAADGETLFYVTEDPAKRPYRLYRHRLGAIADDLVYEEQDALFNLGVERSRSLTYLFASSASFTTTEVRYLPAREPAAPWQVLLAREKDHEYHVDHGGALFYIRTNGGGRRNFRLVAAPVDDPRPARWTELIQHREDAMLEDVEVFAEHYVVHARQDGLIGYDPSRYRTERVHATAPDGTRVPLSLVCRADTPRDGSSPLLLTGYGAYGLPYPVLFSSTRLSLLDRGVTMAIAHVRGGGELGKRWHDEGRMLKKLNTFTDFIA